MEKDIVSLQLAKSFQEFSIANALFTKKWRKDASVKEFLDYFEVQYLQKNNGLFEGLSIGSPSTNICIESTNNMIKQEGTLRKRLELGQFFEAAKSLLIYTCPEHTTRNP
jgi:hypothetical protein